jgi:hypothetical protein
MEIIIICLAFGLTWVYMRFRYGKNTLDWQSWTALLLGSFLGYGIAILLQVFNPECILDGDPTLMFRVLLMIAGLSLMSPSLRTTLYKLFPQYREDAEHEDPQPEPTGGTC